jgi:hypothetical protein
MLGEHRNRPFSCRVYYNKRKDIITAVAELKTIDVSERDEDQNVVDCQPQCRNNAPNCVYWTQDSGNDSYLPLLNVFISRGLVRHVFVHIHESAKHFRLRNQSLETSSEPGQFIILHKVLPSLLRPVRQYWETYAGGLPSARKKSLSIVHTWSR